MVDVSKISAVFDWKMTNEEAHAYYLATLWEFETKKMFPKEKLTRLPSIGDPRKCTLFKYCWKLVRETRGLLTSDEYYEYIRGNLYIIKSYKGRLEPNCLVGDKAWIRWRVWQRNLAREMAKQKQEPLPPLAGHNIKLINELDCTKKFLYEKMGGSPSFDKLEYSKLTIWIETGKVSKYYLVLSPWIKKIGLDKLEKECGFSREVYKSDLNVQEYFKKEFIYEY